MPINIFNQCEVEVTEVEKIPKFYLHNLYVDLT